MKVKPGRPIFLGTNRNFFALANFYLKINSSFSSKTVTKVHNHNWRKVSVQLVK